MPPGVYQHVATQGFQRGHPTFISPEVYKKIGKSLKGNKHAFGHRHSLYTRERISKSHLGKPSGMLGKIAWNKGVVGIFKHSEESRRKMSENVRRRELCNFWKGGVS